MKKILSLILAITLLMTTFMSTTAFAVSETESARETKIYFETPEIWGTVEKVYCHLYPIYGGKEIKEFRYQAKDTKCELVDGENNLFSFDTSKYCLDTDTSGYAIEDNADYGVLFSAINTEGRAFETYSITLGIACMGDTAYVTGGDTTFAPDDFNRVYIAEWKNNSDKYGREARITSVGKITGEYFPVYQPIEEIVAKWLAGWAVLNEEIITTEKVKSVCTETGAEPQKVYDTYAEMFADELADIENNPTVATLEKIRELLGLTRETKIYFEGPEEWGTIKNAYCHLYSVYGGKEIKQFAFQSKKEKCELVDAESNLFSFDTAKYCLDDDTSGYAIEDNADYGVLFSAINTEGRAFYACNLTLGSACIGDTVYVTGTDPILSPEDGNPSYLAKWKNNSDKYGYKADILSTGDIKGEYFPVYQSGEEITAQWLGSWAVLNEKIITTDIVKNICTATKADPQGVYDTYSVIFSKQLANIENAPNIAPLEKIAVLLGLEINTLGDVNNDGTINITDATEIMKYSAELIGENEINLKYADVNDDGIVNVLDATEIQKSLAGI